MGMPDLANNDEACERSDENVIGPGFDFAGFGRFPDSVRLYLREMTREPLLTQEGEVVLAKQIDKSKRTIQKTLSRSPLIWQVLLETRSSLAAGTLSARQVLRLADDFGADPALDEEDQDTTRKSERLFAEVLESMETLQTQAAPLRPKSRARSRARSAKSRRQERFTRARLVEPH